MMMNITTMNTVMMKKQAMTTTIMKMSTTTTNTAMPTMTTMTTKAKRILLCALPTALTAAPSPSLMRLM